VTETFGGPAPPQLGLAAVPDPTSAQLLPAAPQPAPANGQPAAPTGPPGPAPPRPDPWAAQVDPASGELRLASPKGNVRLEIDGEGFEGPPDLPAIAGLRFLAAVDRWQEAGPEETVAMLPELFGHVLLPESLERFVARLDDQARPISLKQLPQVIAYLFTRYGMRPTPPSSGSSTGPGTPAAGPSSTAAPPSPGPTSSSSPSPGS
jgi:hypothetical protein